MTKLKSLILFVLLIIITLFFSYLITGKLFPPPETENLWLYSGIVMVIFSMFFIEPYYTAPTNVTAHSVAILLVLLSVKGSILQSNLVSKLWTAWVFYVLSILTISLLSLVTGNKNKSSDDLANKISEIAKAISVRFGSGKLLYSGMFLLFLFLYHSIQDNRILGLLIFWILIVISEPAKAIRGISKAVKPDHNEIGQIFGVQSKKIFLAKLFSDKPASISKFDLVEFNYSMQEYSKNLRGIVFDSYLLNQEKWIKILHIGYSQKNSVNPKKNIVYKLSKGSDVFISDILERFVGIVIERSDIGAIKFEYSTKGVDLQEGDLVEVKIGKGLIYYQIVNGVTNKESLEAKNESGFIEVEAVQLGAWNSERDCFERFGWVPEINSLVLKARTDIKSSEMESHEFKLGIIPGTTLPAIIDLNQAVTYHIGILGVTGSGKSFIAKEIIKELIKNTKVICVDFTGEYLKTLSDLNPKKVIQEEDNLEELADKVTEKEQDVKTASWQEKKDRKKELNDLKSEMKTKLTKSITDFMNSNQNLSIFELPDLSNTTFILEFTQMFLESIFKYAKKEGKHRICIVIEEAHTVIPETTSLGDFGDYGSNKALVNKISQIALQGRKYNVGFMIVAQRTANVSKTVLTQCNSMICFQAFDNTSYDFLGNYLGSGLIKVLPNLKPYHAIVTGKALKSNIPMIVDLTRN